MRFRTLAVAAFAAVWMVASCGPKDESGKAVATSASTTGESGKPSANTTGTGTGTGLSTSSIPAELKGSAYEYYGLESPKTAMTTTSEPKLSGFVEYSLDKATAEEAIFRVSYSGDLRSELGSGKVAVRKDGIYNIEQSGNPITPPALDLPNDLSPGKTWTVKVKVKSEDGRLVSQNTTDKVIGPTKVQVEGKTYDAIQVQEKGEFEIAGQKSSVVANKWFVKGKGVIRQTIDLAMPNNQNKKMEIIVTEKAPPADTTAAPTAGSGK